jgi:hypothetical protein
MEQFDILKEVEKIEGRLDEIWTDGHSEDIKEIKKSLYRIVNNYALIESRGL